METLLNKRGIAYESAQSGSTMILMARFQGGTQIRFTCSPEDDIRSTLCGTLDDKVEDRQQRIVAATFMAKANFTLNNGKFRIDLSDGEVAYQASLPMTGMPCGDSVRVLASWFNMFMGTFGAYLDSLKALIKGRSVADAEAALAESLKKKKGGGSSGDSAPGPSEATATAPFLMQAMEDIFTEREYVYEVFNNDDDFTLKAGFKGGYIVRFTSSPENHLRTTLRANFEDKVEVVSRRSVASMYFAKVNFALTSGKFEFDVRDGELVYACRIPLQGMTKSDCVPLLQKWFAKFMAIIRFYLPAIKVIAAGGSIEDAGAAEGGAIDSSPPSPVPVSDSSRTVRISTSSGEGAVAARALKDLLRDRGDCSSLETHVDGDAHVVHGVYEYSGEKAVIWARDNTDERLLEMRVFMVDSVPPGRMEALSGVIDLVNATVEGEFKLDWGKGLLFYEHCLPYGGHTGQQLQALVRGKSLQNCLETHLEFLPSIKKVLDKEDTIRPHHPATDPGMVPPQDIPPSGLRSTPPAGGAAGAAGMMTTVPQLAVEDLDFQDEAGRGGMGVVRKAVYRRGAEVAVKELLPTLARSDYELFVREMQLHFSIPPFPHIVPMVGVTQRSRNDKALRLVTDWCNGGSLQELLNDAFGGDDEREITFGDALKYARHIAAGIDHLHRHNLLHLDLKPGNVLLDRAGSGARASLTDFGLSKIISNATQTSNRVLGGTYGFMAPEVIEPVKFTTELRSGPHTDVYALGVTIFLLFFGLHRPFKPGISGDTLCREVCGGGRPEFPVGFSWPGGRRVTERVKGLIQGCWAGDPKRRPSAAHVLNVLFQIELMVKEANGMGRKIPPQSLP
eukprot:g6309.t1